MSHILLLNKPYQVLSQFSDSEGRTTLKQYLPQYEGFYPAGRLDYDSEGLLLLTDNGQLQNQISHPKHKLPKTYWVQVEGVPDQGALNLLRQGVALNDGLTKPAKVQAIAEPRNLWPRTPPIRERKNAPTQWLSITIQEGRNRQVRRMTAAVGHPTLRLIRAAIGSWQLGSLKPGEHRIDVVHVASKASAPRNRRRPTKSSNTKRM